MPSRGDVAERAMFGAPPGLTLEPNEEGLEGAVVVSFPVVAARPREPLTRAESEVLAAVGLGLSNHEIARRRGVAMRTIANQLAEVFRKLGVRSRLEATRFSGALPSELGGDRCPRECTG